MVSQWEKKSDKRRVTGTLSAWGYWKVRKEMAGM
jgi:hypothetical protein